jgi:hypothetical protein
MEKRNRISAIFRSFILLPSSFNNNNNNNKNNTNSNLDIDIGIGIGIGEQLSCCEDCYYRSIDSIESLAIDVVSTESIRTADQQSTLST